MADGPPLTLAFTAAAGPAAGLVIRHVAEALPQAKLVVLASRPLLVSGVAAELVDLTRVDLDERLRGVDVVVHLGIAVDDRDPYLADDGRCVAEARAVIESARRCGVAEVVVVSSSLVLGAQPTNPVPMTETAVVRAEPSFRPAVEMAEIERLVRETVDRSEFRAVTVLRCAPVVSDGSPGWLAGELHRSLTLPIDGDDPALQYVHAVDLGEAVVTVLATHAGGVVHVAPDGALSGAQRRALEARPRLRVPDSAARIAASIRASLRGSDGPEGIRTYLVHPWQIANDRLRSLGWEPTRSNEEAYVAAFRPAPWSMMGSGRRQEVLLGAVGAAAAGVALGVGMVFRRRRR